MIWLHLVNLGAVDPIDALKVVRFDAGLNVAKPENCPELASLI